MKNFMSYIFGDKTSPVDNITTVFQHAENPRDEAISWAKRILHENNLDAAKNPMSAMKCLREHEKGLSLKGSLYLAEKVKETR